MKKKFIEPEIIRIDLKLSENIAASEQFGTSGYSELSFSVYTRQYVENCQVYYVRTEIEPYNHSYTNTDQLVIAIAGGSCFTNPLDQARAFRMYGIN